MRQTLLLGAVLALCGVAHATPETAQALVQQGDFVAASNTLDRYLAAHPSDAEARFLLARTLAWQGRPEAALPHYRQLLATQPDNVDFLLGYGQALLWAGRPNEALPPLEHAARLAPEYAQLDALILQARRARLLPATPAATDALPASPARRRTEIGLVLRHDRLDSGYDDWNAQRLSFTSSQPEATSWYGAVLRERRFGQHDHGVELGAVIPLGPDWALQPEIGVQPGADFLPRWHADLRLQRRFASGWVGAASVRHTRYADTRVDRLALTAEHYHGDWRAAWTANVSRASGIGTQLGHDLSLDRYYAGLSFVGVRASFGREDALDAGGVVGSRVRSLALRGRHWFDERWAVGWEAGRLRQGDLYRRSWLQIGLHHAF
jgi:YaiO family outer membrane protein